MGKSALILGITLATASFGFSQMKKKPAAPPTCPICHMALASKKSASNPVAVRLTKGGKIQYCCPKCKMPASVLVKSKKA